MNRGCGCCDGPRIVTPASTSNRPGLSRLRYRVGIYATFFETMQARLSGADLPELGGLRTRERSDPSIALLDAWAVVADVLTFYQERIANEGYLRTATERYSILELARLIGYELRPGVAASAYLAYSIEKDAQPVDIPAGTRASSLPGPGEQMQTFETADPLTARYEWNELRPRQAQPQSKGSIAEQGLYLQGVATGLKPNDPLLISFDGGASHRLVRAETVEIDSVGNRTRIALRREGTLAAATPRPPRTAAGVSILADVVGQLKRPPSVPPASAKALARDVSVAYRTRADTLPRLMGALQPTLADTLYAALKNLPPGRTTEIRVHALRVSAAPFGNNSPLRVVDFSNNVPQFDEWQISHPFDGHHEPHLAAAAQATHHDERTLFLDNDYDMAPDSLIVIDRPDTQPDLEPPIITVAAGAPVHRSLAAYGLSGKTVQINLPEGHEWLVLKSNGSSDDFSVIRSTRVYAGSERLELADAPVTENIGEDLDIELDGLYEDLEPGRWIVVSGERADLLKGSGAATVSVPGVRATELAMLAAVTQKTKAAPGDRTVLAEEKIHTFISLAQALAYRYRRDTVKIYGNVVKATHGETRDETLGSGDAAKTLQQFSLKQPPLTYVSAPTVSGVDSTLVVRVNDVQWHEAESLAALTPNDRAFITHTDDDAKTSVIFGNGEHGARLPTGLENVKAYYRNGIGKPGNVRTGQITLLTSRPLGVKEVVNPIRASGGADKETRDQARKNAPLALMALDRLVSTPDYADFARTFAGIGKASAARLSDGRRHFVQVTIAGVDDIPIETTSDLYRNLYAALHRYGDPQLPIRLALRERLALVVGANVRLRPDYLWEAVEPKIRAAMLEEFGFERLELGDDLFLAKAMTVLQSVTGVAFVDVDVFDTISESGLLDRFDKSAATGLTVRPRILIATARVAGETGAVLPSQLAYLAPEVPDTLILQEIKS
jgi:predicted phage baseplate assembly protein